VSASMHWLEIFKSADDASFSVSFRFELSNTTNRQVKTKVRVGGAIQSTNLISYVAPVYPPLAKQARLQGDVVLEVEIAREGDVPNLKVVRGPACLFDAARQAVRNWKYKPTLLNGQPVEVVSQITVPFRLAPDSQYTLNAVEEAIPKSATSQPS